MLPVIHKTSIIRGPTVEVIRDYCHNGPSSLAAYLLVSDITRAFSKDTQPKNICLRGAFNAVATSSEKISLVLPSSKTISRLTVETDEGNLIDACSLCTGTMTAYAEPDTPFNKSTMFSRNDNALVYVDPKTRERWLFLLSGVPAGRLDEPNVILVAEHPLYSLEVNNKDIVVKPDALDPISGFPTKSGWYPGDPEHDIPVGDRIDRGCPEEECPDDPKARRLSRVDDAGRVGHVVRYCIPNDWFKYAVRTIGLSSEPSIPHVVAVEAPRPNLWVDKASGAIVLKGMSQYELDELARDANLALQLSCMCSDRRN